MSSDDTTPLPIIQRDPRFVRGTIRYTSNKPERKGEERGREYFLITRHSDGKRTASAHCEIDDRPNVMRDIVYGLDADWLPTDCSVRLSVGDRFMGSAWFRFAPDHAECEAWTAHEGRVHQRMELDAPLLTFQNHAIVCDSWHFRLYDRSKGPGIQGIDTVLLSSPDHRGATGPMLFRIGMGMEYVGEEVLEVEAGRFDALHFRFVSAPGLPQEHPDYDVWCTNDGEFLFLKAQAGGYMQTVYETVELHYGP